MAVETLLPDAAGDATNWPSIAPSGGTHWVVVSDSLDTTYIRNNTTTPQEDDFNLGASSLTTETIDSIDVRSRARSETSAVGDLQVGLRLGTVNSLAPNHGSVPTTATDFTDSNISRPGGGGWTVADLGTLQLVAIGDGNTTAIRCFELAVDVNYTAAGGTTATLGYKTLLGVGI